MNFGTTALLDKFRGRDWNENNRVKSVIHQGRGKRKNVSTENPRVQLYLNDFLGSIADVSSQI